MAGARRHVLLVGLPGAGKTTVGQLAAAGLGAPFHDADVRIVERAGQPVGRIFAEWGEARFREFERAVMRDLLAGPAAVLAPGGGWAAQEGALEEARDASLIIYLRLSPEAAVARAAGTDRPLLVGDSLVRMRNLLAVREGFYRRADLTIDAEQTSATAVATRIIRAARQVGGW